MMVLGRGTSAKRTKPKTNSYVRQKIIMKGQDNPLDIEKYFPKQQFKFFPSRAKQK